MVAVVLTPSIFSSEKKAAPYGAAFFVLVDGLDSSLTSGSVLIEGIAPCCNQWPSLMLAGCFVNPQRKGCAGDDQSPPWLASTQLNQVLEQIKLHKFGCGACGEIGLG